MTLIKLDATVCSTSDFQIGESQTGTDFSAYNPSSANTQTATNVSGSSVTLGSGIGQVDPAIAKAAGYRTNDAFT